MTNRVNDEWTNRPGTVHDALMDWRRAITITEVEFVAVRGLRRLVRDRLGDAYVDGKAVDDKTVAGKILQDINIYLANLGYVFTTDDDLSAISIVTDQLISANESLKARLDTALAAQTMWGERHGQQVAQTDMQRKIAFQNQHRADTAERNLGRERDESKERLKRITALEQEIERLRNDKELVADGRLRDDRNRIEGRLNGALQENARLEADNQVLTIARDAVMRDNDLLRKRKAVLQDQLAATYEQVGHLQREQNRITPGNLGARLLVMTAERILVVCEKHGRLFAVEPERDESVDEVVKGHRELVGCAASVTLSAEVESHHSGRTVPESEL